MLYSTVGVYPAQWFAPKGLSVWWYSGGHDSGRSALGSKPGTIKRAATKVACVRIPGADRQADFLFSRHELGVCIRAGRFA